MALIQDAIELIELCARMSDAAQSTMDFGKRLQPHGLVGITTRVYLRPVGPLTSQAVWDAGGAVASLSPAGWDGSPGHRYICLDQNPLLDAVAKQMPWFRFSDLAPHQDKTFGTYWEAFSEGRIGDGLGIVSFGPKRRVASLSLTFSRLEFSAAEFAALRAAGSVLMERISLLRIPPEADIPTLTRRERDCMAYVAEGKSDWEISVIFGIAQATVHFHIENARRKLSAATRAHAVARMAALDMI